MEMLRPLAFLLADDFNDGSIDTTDRWDIASGTPTESSGILTVDGTGGAVEAICSKYNISRPFIAEIEGKPSTNNNWNLILAWTPSYDVFFSHMNLRYHISPYWADDDGAGNYHAWSTVNDNNLWVDMTMIGRSNGTSYFKKVSSVNTQIKDYSNVGTHQEHLICLQQWGSGASGGKGDYDNLKVKRYLSTTPTNTFGSEEILYSDSGNLESSVLDIENVSLGTLTWNASITASTIVKFQIASSPDNVSWTSFQGADGATDTYYTTSGADIYSGHDGNRYIKYKAFLETIDSAETPYIHDVTVNYNY